MSAATVSDLYTRDFYAWTQESARLLQEKRFSELDVQHLIEEIQSMGASERRELLNRLEVLLIHLLKWHYQPVWRGQGWQLTLKEQRRKLARLLLENPSLKALLQQAILDAYGDAVLSAAKETGLAESTFPTQCPYTEAQIFDMGYYPD